MAFGSKKKEVYQINSSLSPTEQECSKLIDILTTEFFELQKVNEYIKDNIDDLQGLSSKEYRKKRKQM
jgi:hypothetical protein